MERKRMIQPAAKRRNAEPGAWRAPASLTKIKPERRVSTRHESEGAHGADMVRLVDLSVHGCCIGFGVAVDYRPGQFIRLGFPGESEAIRAIVRWVEGKRIGAEFTRSLPSAKIDAILSENRNPLVGLL